MLKLVLAATCHLVEQYANSRSSPMMDDSSLVETDAGSDAAQLGPSDQRWARVHREPNAVTTNSESRRSSVGGSRLPSTSWHGKLTGQPKLMISCAPTSRNAKTGT